MNVHRIRAAPKVASIASMSTACALLVGCNATESIEQQGEKVAKNWSYAIRASQVMPVYPLTEDLQPGDVFLVQVALPDEVSTWNDKGYLPLTNHLARLDSLEGQYKTFYQPSYWQGTYATVPHARPAPAEGAAALAAASAAPQPGSAIPAPGAAEAARLAAQRRFAGAEAPLAAFPTYSFDVTRSGGLSLALPVQGIPIALGLAGAERATASVTLSDAIAYGLATNELFKALDTWSRDPEVKAMLSALQQQSMLRADGRQMPFFLRVVNRVYLIGAVNVTLNTTEALSGDLRGGGAAMGGAAGAMKLSMPDLTQRDAVASYSANLAALSDAVSSTLPGGDIRFGYIADNSVSLSEAFPRPLAIGFIGFDVPIMDGGVLGVPIATRTRLDASEQLPAVALPMGELSPRQTAHVELMKKLQRWAASPEPARQAKAAEAVKSAAASLANRPGMSRFNEWLVANPSAPATEMVEQFALAASSVVSEGGNNPRGYDEIDNAVNRALSP